uniref:PVR related immunoglobulin domain containing n=1 Tax=Pongo abelii TaxID=9601 RepID=A0A8I5UBW5_PONAB
MRTEAQVLALQPPEPGLKGAVGRRTLALPWVLLTLCVTAGTPEVWVPVRMEATELSSFTVRCGFLGSGSISLVTVSWGGPDGAGGTTLAVLHRELASAPAPTPPSAASLHPSLRAPGRPVGAFRPAQTQVGLGRGIQEGLSAPPTPAPILRADLAGILGVSGVLLFGCGYLLHLLHRQKHRPAPRLQPSHTSSQALRARAWAPSQASQAALHVPYATINTSCCPATLDTAHPHGGPSWWASLPTHAAHRPQGPAAWASTPIPACGSFVSVENGLYAQAGERPPRTGPGLTLFPDPRGPRAMEGRLGVR